MSKWTKRQHETLAEYHARIATLRAEHRARVAADERETNALRDQCARELTPEALADRAEAAFAKYA